MGDLEDIETRIKRANRRRDALYQKRAEKVALLNNAKDKMEKLKEKAAAIGITLEELPDLIERRKEDLREKVEQYEEELSAAEEALVKYE